MSASRSHFRSHAHHPHGNCWPPASTSPKPTAAPEIEDDLAQIEKELQADQLSATARASKEATLELLRKRLSASRRRAETLAEIESDLERIEAQFSLAMESSAIRAKPAELHLAVDLTSRMITTTEIVDERLLQ